MLSVFWNMESEIAETDKARKTGKNWLLHPVVGGESHSSSPWMSLDGPRCLNLGFG